MLNIEKKHGMKKSIEYLEGYLEERDMTYDAFILELIKPKGILATLLDAFKRLFR